MTRPACLWKEMWFYSWLFQRWLSCLILVSDSSVIKTQPWSFDLLCSTFSCIGVIARSFHRRSSLLPDSTAMPSVLIVFASQKTAIAKDVKDRQCLLIQLSFSTNPTYVFYDKVHLFKPIRATTAWLIPGMQHFAHVRLHQVVNAEMYIIFPIICLVSFLNSKLWTPQTIKNASLRKGNMQALIINCLPTSNMMWFASC